MTRSINRRTFLQAAGLAASSFFLPSLARADEAPPTRPRRVVFMMTELGWNPFPFRMAPEGAPEELLHRSAYHPHYKNEPDPHRWEIDLTRTSRDRFSTTLDPLYPIRDRVIALDGLGLLSTGADRLGDAHARGWNHALSGFPAGEYITGQRAMGGRPSLDMQIARALRERESHLTDLTALHFLIHGNVYGGGTNTFHHFFYDQSPSGEIVKVPLVSDPREAFRKLFPTVNGGDQVNPQDVGRRHVFDLLNRSYNQTFRRIGIRDRRKLEFHRQLISDIQHRLDILDGFACFPPSYEYPENVNDFRNMPGEDAFDINTDAFFKIAATAMSCDLSRVVCFQFPNDGGIQGPIYGSTGHDMHEWYSHGTDPTRRWYGLEGANVSQALYDKFVDASPVLANKNRFHVSQAARFAQLLDEIPDGDGTLLDNTLIVLMDEISHGGHGHDQWPVVLIGGFGGAFRTGRYIRFPRTNPHPGGGFNGSGDFAGVPHSHLLISILQHMGIETDTLGLDSIYGRSWGHPGRSISLRGPLYELA